MSESSQALIGRQSLSAEAVFRGPDIDYDLEWHHRLEELEASKRDEQTELSWAKLVQQQSHDKPFWSEHHLRYVGDEESVHVHPDQAPGLYVEKKDHRSGSAIGEAFPGWGRLRPTPPRFL